MFFCMLCHDFLVSLKHVRGVTACLGVRRTAWVITRSPVIIGWNALKEIKYWILWYQVLNTSQITCTDAEGLFLLSRDSTSVCNSLICLSFKHVWCIFSYTFSEFVNQTCCTKNLGQFIAHCWDVQNDMPVKNGKTPQLFFIITVWTGFATFSKQILWFTTITQEGRFVSPVVSELLQIGVGGMFAYLGWGPSQLFCSHAGSHLQSGVMFWYCAYSYWPWT